MKIENFLKGTAEGAIALVCAQGSFGSIADGVVFSCEKQENTEIYTYKNDKVALVATFEKQKNGVIIRRDYLENLSSEPVEINNLCSRFYMDGNSYEVYTQYNAWQHESMGNWQKLVTKVTCESQGIRTCDGAAPIMALYNLHSGQSTVFHLLPNAMWKMSARKFAEEKKETIIVETGFNNEYMQLVAEAGERIELPEIIFFGAKSKTDLDAYKLHELYNSLYPRKSMPVAYNSWLYCFDRLNVDALLEQVDCAAELGIEAFMIDAGWFGQGERWYCSVGDWSENETSGPCGRLIEVSERVRSHGMTFGLWFEPERADPASEAVKNHPEWFINGTLFDFSCEEAVDNMLYVLSSQIEKYNIGWLKFDFNATTPTDPSGNIFYRYMQGQKRFVEALREKYPDMYITGCASGGYRMELSQGKLFDSFWLSDNQGPYEGIRIVKDTLKRMPTSLIERWNVQKYCSGFPSHDSKDPVSFMLSCNNGTWDFIINVADSFTRQFISSGPIGFSHDLKDMPNHYKDMWKDHISSFKRDREFYLSACARILIDTEDIIAIQYSDANLDRIEIQLFTKTVYAENIIVYPELDRNAEYSINGVTESGKSICEDGIRFKALQDNSAYTAQLIKK